jgi:hypothetical protein
MKDATRSTHLMRAANGDVATFASVNMATTEIDLFKLDKITRAVAVASRTT